MPFFILGKMLIFAGFEPLTPGTEHCALTKSAKITFWLFWLSLACAKFLPFLILRKISTIDNFIFSNFGKHGSLYFRLG